MGSENILLAHCFISEWRNNRYDRLFIKMGQGIDFLNF